MRNLLSIIMSLRAKRGNLLKDCFVVTLFLLAMTLTTRPVHAATSSIFSLSLWVNPTSSVASKALIGKSEEMRVFTNASGFVGCQIKATTWQTAAQSTTQALAVGKWSHVVCTYDKVNLTVYVNGTQTVQPPLTATADDTANALKIGQDDSASTPYGNLSGIIDEFKFYNYPLTSDEVKVEYNQAKSIVLGALSDTSGLTGGSVASNSASAAYCIPGDSTSCATPVGEWKMEEKKGTSVSDSSGNNLTASFTNTPTWTMGKVGSALSVTVSGSNYISVTDTTGSVLDITGSYTVSSWIYPQAYPASFHYVVDKGGQLYGMYLNATGNVVPVQNNLSRTATTNSAPLNKWTHVAITYDGGTITKYLNGVIDSTQTVSVTINTDNNSLVFGNPGDGSGAIIIDEARIYNYARTPAQIAWDYNRGKPVAHWKMDECQGAAAYDSSGNGNAGTITISGTGSQTTAGTCISPTDGTGAWYNGSSGKYNASLKFDGTDDYVSVLDTTNLRMGTSNWSTSAWIKSSQTSGTYQIIDKRNSGPTVRYQMTLTNGKLWAELRSTTTPDVSASVTGTKSIADGQWHHVLAIYTRASNLVIYVDGKSDGSISIASMNGVDINGSSEFKIGAVALNNSLPFNGQIDDVKVWNYPLTASQVKLDYNQSAAVRFAPITGTP